MNLNIIHTPTRESLNQLFSVELVGLEWLCIKVDRTRVNLNKVNELEKVIRGGLLSDEEEMTLSLVY